MAKSETNPAVDAFLKNADAWRPEMAELRKISLRCGLAEELKWGKPCYTFEGANVLIVQPFKNYCALMFCQGALLKDPQQLLVKPGENTQAARQARFTNRREILDLAETLESYIGEAIAAEKAGRKVEFTAIKELKLPDELEAELASDRALKKAFEALTPGRQRAYAMFFAAAKQTETRKSRIEKCRPQILAGRGLNDR